MVMNRHGRLRLTLTIPLLLVLTACGDKVHVKATKPPVELLTCADEPIAPQLPARDGTPETDKTRDMLTLAYVLAWRAAWGSCRSSVEGVTAWADRLP